jgi:putative polyhydroxyalkanoate system protein
MAEIMMRRAHSLDAGEIRSRIGGLADKISNRLGGSWDWQGDEAICEARGAKARVGYDKSTIFVEISLPKIMRPFRRKLEAKIDEYLERFLDAG